LLGFYKFSEEVLHPNLKRQLENLGFEEPCRKYSVLNEGLILEFFPKLLS
jgi:hypothetical protein